MSTSLKDLRYRDLARRNQTYASYADSLFAPQLLNTDGTVATGYTREVVKTPFEKDIFAISSNSEIDAETKQQLLNERVSAEYGPKSFDINDFQDLLSRLEGSKMRQQRQKSVEGRRDTMADGLASMMSNF